MSKPDDITSAFQSTVDREWDLVGIGACTWDTLMTVPDFAGGGSVVRADSMIRQGGGPVATALCQAASMGCECAMIDRLGKGSVARLVTDDLMRFGVDGRWLQTGEGEPARAMIQVRTSDGERAIVYHPATHDLEPELPTDLKWSDVRCLHVNGRHDRVAREAMVLAREAGGLISFDGGAGRWRPGMEAYLTGADVLVVAAGFALAATGVPDVREQVVALRDLAPQALVVGVTCGADGAWLCGPESDPFHVPAWKPSRVIDTTGAGDVYHGALLAGLLRGEALGAAARLAALRAGFNCGFAGGRGGLACNPPAPQ